MVVWHCVFVGEEVAVVFTSVKDDKRKIGENLRKMREAKGLTQEKLAERMDVDTQTVYRMESGRYSMETFLAAVLALGINVQDVFPDNYQQKSNEECREEIAFRELKEIPKDKRNFILDAMDSAKRFIMSH